MNLDPGPKWQPLSRAVQQRVARLRSLKGRRKTGLFLIEGFRLLEAALEHRWPIETIVVRDDEDTRSRLALMLKEETIRSAALYVAPAKTLEDLAATQHPAGVIALARVKITSEPGETLSGSRFLFVDNVRDPGNLGAILRSAAAFGIDAVYLSDGTVDAFNPKVVRASMGGLFALPIYQNVDLRKLGERVEQEGYIILVANPHKGQPPYRSGDFQKWALVIGGETEGYAEFWQTLKVQPIRIPISPRVESLNSAVAAGIILSCLSDISGEGA